MEVEETGVETPVEETPVEETQDIETSVGELEKEGSAEGTSPEANPEESESVYELPDGKRVDAQTLAKEWRDNFLPEFTRKSQELAALKNPKPAEAPKTPETPPWKSAEWEPTTYQEILDAAKTEAEQTVWQKIVEESERGAREQQEREAYIASEIEQIKALDPKTNVNAVIAHASKYAFPSLINAFQNMKAIEEAERRIEKRVMKNMKLRDGEPIEGGSASGSQKAPSFAPGKGFDEALKIIRNK